MFTQENDFYVCLLSSNSMKYYGDNTLSSFTNHLSSPCNLNSGDWKVGVTEIAFNSYVNDKLVKNIRNKRSVDTRILYIPQVNSQLTDPNISNINEANKLIVVQGETQTTPHGSFIPVTYIPKALSQIPDPVNKNPSGNISLSKDKDVGAIESSPSVTKKSKK